MAVPDTSRSDSKRRRSPTRRLGFGTALVRNLVLGAFALFWLLPLVWLVIAPSKTDNQITNDWSLSWGSFETYAETWADLLAFNRGAIVGQTLRSIYYAFAALILAVGVCLLAGYGLATVQFKGRRILLGLTLATMILPVSATVLPLFLGMNFVGLLDTPASVILPMAFFPFGTYLAYIYFRRTVPESLLEAAALDGATVFQTFTRVALPLSKPIVGLLAFLNFTFNWNRFFLPFVMLNSSDTVNLPVGLDAMVSATSALQPTFLGRTPIERPEVALASLILATPVALVFIFAQRYVISGSLTGAIKD